MKRIQITVEIENGKVHFPQIEFSKKIQKEERKELMDTLSFDLYCLFKKIKKHVKKKNNKNKRIQNKTATIPANISD